MPIASPLDQCGFHVGRTGMALACGVGRACVVIPFGDERRPVTQGTPGQSPLSAPRNWGLTLRPARLDAQDLGERGAADLELALVRLARADSALELEARAAQRARRARPGVALAPREDLDGRPRWRPARRAPPASGPGARARGAAAACRRGWTPASARRGASRSGRAPWRRRRRRRRPARRRRSPCARRRGTAASSPPRRANTRGRERDHAARRLAAGAARRGGAAARPPSDAAAATPSTPGPGTAAAPRAARA